MLVVVVVVVVLVAAGAVDVVARAEINPVLHEQRMCDGGYGREVAETLTTAKNTEQPHNSLEFQSKPRRTLKRATASAPTCLPVMPRISSKEAFFQMTLRRFGAMPRLPLATPLPVLPLIRAALDLPEAGWTQTDGDKDDLAQVGVVARPVSYCNAGLRQIDGDWSDACTARFSSRTESRRAACWERDRLFLRRWGGKAAAADSRAPGQKQQQ